MAEEIPSLFSIENRTIPVLVLHGAKSLHRRPASASAAASISRRRNSHPFETRPSEAPHPSLKVAGGGLEARGQNGARSNGYSARGEKDEEEETCPLSPLTLSSRDHADGSDNSDGGVGGGRTSADGGAGAGGGGGGGGRVGGGDGGGGEARDEQRRRLQDAPPYGEDYFLVRNKLEGFFSPERRARLERAGNLDRLEDSEILMPAQVQLEKARLFPFYYCKYPTLYPSTISSPQMFTVLKGISEGKG